MSELQIRSVNKPGELSSEQNGTAPVCEHCGLPCMEDRVSDEGHLFCCSGCAAVYSLLNQHNLCRYYEGGKGLRSEAEQTNELAYLDEEETFSRFVVFSKGETVQFRFIIPGMHCNSCIYLLERLDKLHASVISSRVDFFNKELLVTCHSQKNILSSVVGLLFTLGYRPDLTLSNAGGKKIRKWSSRTVKIGIAGFCFGNIMMLSFPEYLGLSLDASSLVLKRWFDYISLILALPVLLYCSSEFFELSWKGIRRRSLNIDQPVTLAILATFGRSLYELFVSHQAGYFDSMTGIVFFLLTGRYFQDLTYHSLSFDRDYRSYFPLAARKITEEGLQTVNISGLGKDDRIELRNAELLPADAVLLNGPVTVDYSFITGEAKPVALETGNKVYAGAVVKGVTARFRLLDSTDNSRLVKLWSVEKEKDETDRSLTEKINTWFTIGLFIVSTFAFIYQYRINGTEEAFKALTSVLIVACPCILLLATTFANGHLLRVLRNRGMFVRNKNTLSNLSDCDTMVFDKTGTLTDNSAYETEDRTQLYEEELRYIARLAHQSVHPYSQAISKKYYRHDENAVGFTAMRELGGKGLMGTVKGIEYRLGSHEFTGCADASQHAGTSQVYVSVNGACRGCFTLKHSIRKGADSMLMRLDRMGYGIYLSSGDTELNPALEKVRFKEVLLKQQPEDKVKLIAELKEEGKKVCMAGDGLNDAPAMREAHVAVAVADRETAFFPACDVFVTSGSLKRFPDFLKLIRKSRWVLLVSFAFSLVYNVIGLYYAVTAQLSPLVAAILMPSSSVTMLLITWLLTLVFERNVFGRGVSDDSSDSTHVPVTDYQTVR